MLFIIGILLVVVIYLFLDLQRLLNEDIDIQLAAEHNDREREYRLYHEREKQAWENFCVGVAKATINTFITKR